MKPAGVVRLPEVLADYRCGRSLVCCRAPWRAVLGDGERERISSRLASAARGGRAGQRFTGAIEHAEGGPQMLAQRGGSCALLDTPARTPGACALHRAGGLEALPALCRNFPRSVVATPRGIEVAFLLACPTAAARVVDGARDFAWFERPAEGWRFGPVATQSAEVAWDAESTLPFDALEALRSRWWATLGQAVVDASGEALLVALVELARSPGAPGGLRSPDLGELEHTLDPGLATELADALCALPGSGPAYAARRGALGEALEAPCSPAELARSAARAPRVWACAVGLGVQFAGVHTDVPVTIGLHGAAWEGALGLLLFGALTRLEAVSSRDAARDALTIAAQLGCASLTGAALAEGPGCAG